MADTVEITLTPLRSSIVPLTIGTAISFLVVTAAGSAIGLATWAAMTAVYHLANRALGIAGFFINTLSVLIAFWLVSALVALSQSSPEDSFPGSVLRGNRISLKVAKLVTAVAILQTGFSFLSQEASNFVVVQIGNATQLDFLNTTWAFALGVVLPLSFLVLLLVFGAKWSRVPKAE